MNLKTFFFIHTTICEGAGGSFLFFTYLGCSQIKFGEAFGTQIAPLELRVPIGLENYQLCAESQSVRKQT